MNRKNSAFLMSLIACSALSIARCDEVPEPRPDPDVPPQMPVAAIEVMDATGRSITDTAQPGRQIVVSAAKSVRGKHQNSLIWIVEPSVDTWVSHDKMTLVITTPLNPSTIRIQLIVALQDQAAFERVAIKVGSGPRPPPVDPIPDDDTIPDPVDPDPEPEIPKKSLKVLIIEETSARSRLKESQLQILFSGTVRQYAKANCLKEKDGTPSFRIYDPDTDVSKDAEWIRKAMAQPRDSTPWLIVTNGVTGFSGPLPENETALLELLKRYGGE